jgi:hypothetical protein
MAVTGLVLGVVGTLLFAVGVLPFFEIYDATPHQLNSLGSNS